MSTLADPTPPVTVMLSRMGHPDSVAGSRRRVVAEVFGGVLLALPVHAGGLAVVDLHAVHADVALARIWGRG